MTKEEYEEALKRAETETPSLEEFREMQAYDDNVVWRLPAGVIVNLLENAVDALASVVEVLDSIHYPVSNTRMGVNLRLVDPKCAHCGGMWPCAEMLRVRSALDG